jgi:hypothetical protein
MSRAIRSLAGAGNDIKAWDTLFRHFNQSIGRGDAGYQRGEKIVIKINLNTSKHLAWGNRTNVSPQALLALLRQLVYNAGVEESGISVYDASRLIGDPIYDLCHPEFPEVVFIDNDGKMGRVKAQPDPRAEALVYYSHPDVVDSGSTRLPVSVVEADYMINLALLKGHSLAGVTLCAKNHFGSIWHDVPEDDGWRPSNLHSFVAASQQMGTYNALVDLMGHRHLGGKTFLFIIDALYAAVRQGGDPTKWESSPFNGDWTSSIFVSQDGVAIDSVAADFASAEPTLAEYVIDNFDNYLHEAALAEAPPSGTYYDPENDGEEMTSQGVHEHWNNPLSKQYSRNLSIGNGIELIALNNVLVSDFGALGLYTYDGTAWDRINTLDPAGLATYVNNLIVNFPSKGIYEYDGTWTRITKNDSVQAMVGVGSTLYADFGTKGLYQYDISGWKRINKKDPSALATYAGKLAANFPGFGLWEYDGSWTKISSNDTAEALIGVGSTLYGDYGSTGIWQYDASRWLKISGKDPSALAAYGDKLVASFPTYGIHEYDESWSRISKNDTSQGMCGVGSNLYVDFGAKGLYKYDASGWERLSNNNCEDMVAAVF